MSSLYPRSVLRLQSLQVVRGCNLTRWASLFFCLMLLDEVLPRSHLGLHRVMTGIWGDASFYSQSLYADIPFGINTVLQVNELYYALAVEIVTRQRFL